MNVLPSENHFSQSLNIYVIKVKQTSHTRNYKEIQYRKKCVRLFVLQCIEV